MAGCGPNCKCNDAEALLGVQPTPIVAWQPEGWNNCLKQKTRCVIRAAGLEFVGTNSCHVEDAEECPRVTAGSQTGEDYDLCGPPKHAEQEAARVYIENSTPPFREAKWVPGAEPTAYLYGHTYLCKDCQDALVAAGVRNFVVTGEPA